MAIADDGVRVKEEESLLTAWCSVVIRELNISSNTRECMRPYRCYQTVIRRTSVYGVFLNNENSRLKLTMGVPERSCKARDTRLDQFSPSIRRG
jgi:hypothetical protein